MRTPDTFKEVAAQVLLAGSTSASSAAGSASASSAAGSVQKRRVESQISLNDVPVDPLRVVGEFAEIQIDIPTNYSYFAFSKRRQRRHVGGEFTG